MAGQGANGPGRCQCPRCRTHDQAKAAGLTGRALSPPELLGLHLSKALAPQINELAAQGEQLSRAMAPAIEQARREAARLEPTFAAIVKAIEASRKEGASWQS